MQEERKKRIINHMLCQTFNTVDEKKMNNIEKTKSFCERLWHTQPASFEFVADVPLTPFVLVEDTNPKWP